MRDLAELIPYRWFGRDQPTSGWSSCEAADPVVWGYLCPSLPIFQPISGPWASADDLWRALGAADEAAAGHSRSIAAPAAAFEHLAAQFSERLGVPVSADAVAAQWIADLQWLAEIAPGQAPPSDRLTLDALAQLAESPRGSDLSLFATLLADHVLPTIDTIAVPPLGTAVAGRCEVAGGMIVVRVTCRGPCWLFSAAPYAYHAPLCWPHGAPSAHYAALPEGLVGEWFDAQDGPIDAFERVIERIPTAPVRWRTLFWLGVLSRVTPGAIAWAVGLQPVRIGRLAEALAGTPLFAPLLAAVGERLLLCAPHDPSALLSLWQADKSVLSPTERAVVLVLQALELDEYDAITVFLDARDLLRGGLDMSHPTVARLVRAKSRAALLRDPPDTDALARALSTLSRAGGIDAVRDLLDGLVAEGSTTAGELGELQPMLPARAQSALSAWRNGR